MQRITTLPNLSFSIECPDRCPLCHHYCEMSIVKASEEPDRSGAQVVFQCGYGGCKSYFIGYYEAGAGKTPKALEPQKALAAEFPEIIRSLSPSFLEIYEEASEAHNRGMKQIAGPGYRKAFEFLIKDYAKSLSPDRAKDIEKMFSGNVVNEFITDTRIQAVAKRALWLGNDETHYLRKWTSHDIDDLIALIRLAINWIEIEKLSEDYQAQMPE